MVTLIAGVPAHNSTLYHRVRFAVGDPAALILFDNPQGSNGAARSIFIVRDIEVARARATARATRVAAPAEFTPADGLSGDRETATAQAVAECLRREGVDRVRADRTLALSYIDALRAAGIGIDYDPELGVRERRMKDEQEIEWLCEAQATTEEAIALACRLIAGARASAGGALEVDGAPLTSERVREAIDVFLLKRGYTNPESIVAGGPIGADCHDHGHGVLRTAEPVIIDVFPRNRRTLYNGDCTRTVVHGAVPPEVQRMHDAVVRAKRAAIAAIRPGVTGEAVHQATAEVMRAAGFEMGLPGPDDPPSRIAMTHGTGHGLGLDVHEPPLLAEKGPPLVEGDALTVEPGLYGPRVGGVRVEDLVVVTADGCLNLNRLSEGLDWS